jgi:hypothetical protein
MTARQAFAYGRHSKAVRLTLYAAPDPWRPILGRYRIWRFGFEHCGVHRGCCLRVCPQRRIATCLKGVQGDSIPSGIQERAS